jgi:hypothetical protein
MNFITVENAIIRASYVLQFQKRLTIRPDLSRLGNPTEKERC